MISLPGDAYKNPLEYTDYLENQDSMTVCSL